MSKNTKTELAIAKTENKPSPAMLALFNAPAGMEKKLVRRNLPQLVKPDQVPVGGLVSGVILKIVEQASKTGDAMFSLWLRHESGAEFLFPVGGVIRNALLPGVDRKDVAAIKKGLTAEVGAMFAAKRLDDKQSESFKKKMFVFDVFTSKT